MTRKDEIDTARRVDTEVARLWNEFHAVNDQILSLQKLIESTENTIRYSRHEASRVALQNRIDRTIVKIEILTEDAAPLREAAVAYDKENYKGWNRFFLVKHIHNTTRCSSFRPTTRIGWLPKLSGQTETEAVAEHGAILCTICFPTAPVQWTQGIQDDSSCAGSGKAYFTGELTGREQAYYSPAGYCSECGQWTSLTGRGSLKVRKHKFDETKRRITVK